MHRLRRLASFFLFLLLLSLSVGAVRLTTVDDVNLAGFQAQLQFEDGEGSVTIEPGNELSLAAKGSVTVQVVADQIYRGHGTLPAEEILLRPTAKISGHVKDAHDNLLQQVPIKVLCTGMNSNVPSTTDNLGFFTVEEVGFGTCDINVILGERVTTRSLVINESKHYVVTIEAEEPAPSSIIIPTVIAIIVALTIILFIFWKGRSATVEKKEPEEELSADTDLGENTPLKFSKRQNDLLATFSEREQLIVAQLFYNGKLTQSQLRYKTGLPKSSLHRTLESLTRKNIVITKEEAGIKKVMLTEFFKK